MTTTPPTDPQKPAPTPPASHKRRKWPWILGSVVVLFALIVVIAVAANPSGRQGFQQGYDAAAGKTTTAPATSSDVLITTGGPSGLGPGMEICRFDNNGGIYYLYVTSKTVNDLSACQGATPVVTTIDDLLSQPHTDRRCILSSDAAMQQYNAIVGVYSDTTRPDLQAAQQFCAANGGSNS
jgi:hypothetical protein